MVKQVTNEELLEALLINGGVKGAANAIGISESAIFKRLKNDGAFSDEYSKMQGILLTAVTATMTSKLQSAVAVLADTVEDEYSPTGQRINAANMLLSHGLRYVEASSIIRRIEKLEENLKEGRKYVTV